MAAATAEAWAGWSADHCAQMAPMVVATIAGEAPLVVLFPDRNTMPRKTQAFLHMLVAAMADA